MITPTQQTWLQNSLSNDKKIKIVPYDPTAEAKFEVIKNKVQSALGKDCVVSHRGSTNLGISGQDEIDIYVPVSPDDFDKTLPLLEKIFGKPKSIYPLERARFVDTVEGKHIDIFLINQDWAGWLDSVRFEDYLKRHSEALDAYRVLKESMDGFGMREFYERKIEFINDILSRTD